MVDHFAHEPSAACVASHGETREHLRGKDFLLKTFRARGIRAEAEFRLEILSGEADRRADVLVWGPRTGQRFAFEVQHTVLNLKDIMRRTEAYFAGGIPVIWINLLKPKRVENAVRIKDTNINHINKYTTHAWERWAHAFSDEGGNDSKCERAHLWFLDPSTGLMWRGWFSTHYLYQESREYHDASGDYQSHLGGWYAAKNFRTVSFEGPFDLASLTVAWHHRQARKKETFQYPSGLAAWLLTPNEDRKKGPKRPPFRMHREILENGAEIPPRPQIYRDGKWADIERDARIDIQGLWR
jgi:hypothetical protein